MDPTEPTPSLGRAKKLKERAKKMIPHALVLAGSLAAYRTEAMHPSSSDVHGALSQDPIVEHYDRTDQGILHSPASELLFTSEHESSHLEEFVTTLQTYAEASESEDAQHIYGYTYDVETHQVTSNLVPGDLAELDLPLCNKHSFDNLLSYMNKGAFQQSGLTENKLKQAKGVFVVPDYVVTRGSDGSYSFYSYNLLGRHISAEGVSPEDIKAYSDFFNYVDSKRAHTIVQSDKEFSIEDIVECAYRTIDQDEIAQLTNVIDKNSFPSFSDNAFRWHELINLYLTGQTKHERARVMQTIVKVLDKYQVKYFLENQGNTFSSAEEIRSATGRYDAWILTVFRHFRRATGSMVIRADDLETYRRLFDAIMDENLQSHATMDAYSLTDSSLAVNLDFSTVAPLIRQIVDTDESGLHSKLEVTTNEFSRAFKSLHPEEDLGKIVAKINRREMYQSINLPLGTDAKNLIIEYALPKELSEKQFIEVSQDMKSLAEGGHITSLWHPLSISYIIDIHVNRGGNMTLEDCENLNSLIGLIGPNGFINETLLKYASEIDLTRTHYDSIEDLIDFLIAEFSEHPHTFNAKDISHLINNAHEYAGANHTQDYRPYFIDRLTYDGMIALIANGGAHLPEYYYDSPADLTDRELEAVSVGNHDYGIAIYTSTFEMVYKKLATYQEESPHDYRALLLKDKDLLRRYVFMLGRFGHLEDEVKKNPDIFIESFVETLTHSESITDWEMAVDGLVAGLQSHESEAYQQAILDIYWNVSRGNSTHSRYAIGFLVKRIDALHEGTFKEFFKERFAEYPEPTSLSVPDWSEKKVIHVGLFYNEEEVKVEGLPGAISEFQRHGYQLVSAHPADLRWAFQKTLPDGRVVSVEVSTRNSQDIEREGGKIDFAAVLSHSYNYRHFFYPTRNKDFWENTVLYGGFCGSAKTNSDLMEYGYVSPKVGDKDVANGYVNLLASIRLIEELSNPNKSKTWDSISADLGVFAKNWGIKLPGIDQELAQYIVENRMSSLDAHFDQKWNDYWRQRLSTRQVASNAQP